MSTPQEDGTFLVRRRTFTVIYDDQLRQGMSLRAWGLYCYLVGRPDGWECRTHDVIANFAEGRDAVRTARTELVDLGLLVKEPYLDKGLRRLRYVLDPDAAERLPRSAPETDSQALAEEEHHPRSAPETGSQAPDSQAPDSQATGTPAPENPPHIKKDSVSTDSVTTDLRPQAAPADAGREQDDALFAVPSPPPAPQTEGQRIAQLTRSYTDAVPLSNYPAVQGVVRKAVRARRDGQPVYTDQDIRAALARLADDSRAVTTDTLRVALEGLPPPTAPRRITAADENLARGLDIAARQRAAHQQRTGVTG